MDFGADTTTDEVLAGVDLDGWEVIVTGASGGLGEETARALASRGANVTLTARDRARGEAAAERIRAHTDRGEIEVGVLELADFSSVRAFAADWLTRHARLDVLINNAGIMACPLQRTADGFELQFATNHLGHFLLTGLLVPALLAGAEAAPRARIVNVSSAAHKLGAVDFSDPHFDRRPYDKWTAYGQAKTANMLCAVGLERRLADRGIHAFGLHPGGIMTDLGRHLEGSDVMELMRRAKVDPEQGLKLKSVAAGAATTVWAATAAELAGYGGIYLEDCQIAPRCDGELETPGYVDHAVDPEAAERLWAMSEEYVGERFSF